MVILYMLTSQDSSTFHPHQNGQQVLHNPTSNAYDIGDDRISQLPEPVLHHILSFLSTNQAATTSVLSKPWRYLWTWVPDLDISQLQIKKKDISFDRIIFKIFLSRRAWCVRKFNLFCRHSNCDLVSIRSILCAAVEREVEELDFGMSGSKNEFFEFPTSLLCCNTLVVLKLCCDVMISIGSSVNLPRLKVLHLVRVCYKDEDSFRNLFSGCPVLDHIIICINGSVPDNAFHYEISSLTARRLLIHEHSNSPYPPPKITVTAPALEYFNVRFGISSSCVLVLNNVSSLVEANCHIGVLQMGGDNRDTIKDMIGALCNVQLLELSFKCIEVPPDHNIPVDIFPRFDNLVRLKLVSFTCLLPVLLNILSNCSRLEHLTIELEETIRPCKKPQCWIPLQHVPNCRALNLATVKFEGFQATECNLEMARYILNNSKALRKMTVTYRPEINLRRDTYRPEMNLRRVFDSFLKIAMFEKQATKCQLTFQQQVDDTV